MAVTVLVTSKAALLPLLFLVTWKTLGVLLLFAQASGVSYSNILSVALNKLISILQNQHCIIEREESFRKFKF